MSTNHLLHELLDAIADRGRAFVGRDRKASAAGSGDDISILLDRLLSGRGEASGLAIAKEIIAYWHLSDGRERLQFLRLLAERYGTDEPRLARAIDEYRQHPGPQTAAAIHQAAEPRRQELIRRLNRVSGAMEALLEIRAEVLARLNEEPALALVDADFVHLLSSWFNRGFLVLRPIDWSTSASVLERIIRHEAVHAIDSWNELRQRLEPSDRRCFAFFHPRLPDEPLIFVEVALMRRMPARIDEVLSADREMIAARDATTAVFYSISNTQVGLRGVSFGNFLLKQVIETLHIELPLVDRYTTLSPLTGFAAWLAETAPTARRTALLERLGDSGWIDDATARKAIEAPLLAEAADYLLNAKMPAGLPLDPVARFHLGNGAQLERINFLADTSSKAMHEAHGLMVNYLYRPGDIEKNHELYADNGTVIAARAIHKLINDHPPERLAAPRLRMSSNPASEQKR